MARRLGLERLETRDTPSTLEVIPLPVPVTPLPLPVDTSALVGSCNVSSQLQTGGTTVAIGIGYITPGLDGMTGIPPVVPLPPSTFPVFPLSSPDNYMLSGSSMIA